jgi:hypothetical protein
VKLLPEDGELYVCVESQAHIGKERSVPPRTSRAAPARSSRSACRKRRREGRYLLRSNLTDTDPAKLWEFYLQLSEVEAAFRDLKGDLAIRPIFHQHEARIEAHIFVAFMAYCLHVTLNQLLKQRAPGLTPRVVLEKLAAMQLLNVHFPTTDGRELVFTRYTEPESDQQLFLAQLDWNLPQQARPRISAIDAVAL